MNAPRGLQAALFDFNGVLVDDERLHFEGFNAVLAPLGVAITLDAYERVYLGFDDRGVFETALRAHGLDAAPDAVRALIEAKAKVYAARAATELVIFEGARELLRAVSARVPVVIVSGALRGEIVGALRVMGCEGCVRAVVAAEDVSACKPDPEGYLLGLARLREALGEVDPARCVAVEDSLAGVRSAKGAGVGVLAVAHSYPEASLVEAGADRVLATLAAAALEDLEAAAVRR